MGNRNENSRPDDDYPNYLMFMAPPQNSFELSEAILEDFRILLQSQLRNLEAAKGHSDIKVDVKLKSWKESYNRDLLSGKRELVVEFRLDFKSVISYI